MVAWLYTLSGCSACETAHTLLLAQRYEVRKVLVDNPLLELGVSSVFKDRVVHAPVIVIEGRGIFVLDASGAVLCRVVDLTIDKELLHA